MKRRSKGIIFLTSWLIFQGVMCFVMPIIRNIPSDLVVSIPIGLIIILIGIGTLNLVNWVRIVAIILHIMFGLYSFVLAINVIFVQRIFSPITLTLPIAPIGIVYFLTRPKVREQFTRERENYTNNKKVELKERQSKEIIKEMEKVEQKIKIQEEKSKEFRQKGLMPCSLCGIQPASEKYCRKHKITAEKEYLCKECWDKLREWHKKMQDEGIYPPD